MKLYKKLRGRIREYCLNMSSFAQSVGISEKSLYLKLNGQSSFTLKEVRTILRILSLTVKDIPEYFFGEKEEELYLRKETQK